MEVKHRYPQGKKVGENTRPERNSVTQQVELTLRNLKEKIGDVVLIAINDRTSIEIPAYLSQAERDARVENYIRLHNSKI